MRSGSGDEAGAAGPAPAARVPAADLGRLMDRALACRGVPEEHRWLVVDGLLRTSLRGVDTHGVRLFPTYLAELDGGRSKPRPELAWSGSGSARRLDAGGALGLVAGTLAAREAARLATEHGTGAVAVGGSNHFGAASVYTLEMARRGVVGLAFSNSDALVAPFGGRRPFFGTNPLSLAVEGEEGETFCLDMATSQVSYSRIKKARERGEALAPGWAVVAADGRDAAELAPGELAEVELALQPLGGYKGEGLNLVVTVLTALLVGEPFDRELSHLYVPPFDEPRRVAHLFVALAPSAFTEPAAFRGRLSRLLAALRAEPAVPGGAPVIAPGDLERAAEEERGRHGIPLDAAELAGFRAIDGEAPPVERLGL